MHSGLAVKWLAQPKGEGMSQRMVLAHLLGRRRGRGLDLLNVPNETIYLAPDEPVAGRFINPWTGERIIRRTF
jgi:hypothetical protein